MARWRPKECKVCGARVPHVVISALGYCPHHGAQRREANLHDLVTHSGEYFDHWRKRSLAALGVVVDDAPRSE